MQTTTEMPEGPALRAFAGLLAFFEPALYVALGPMLPSLQSELGLTRGASGLLGAAYPLGLVLATVPAGMATDRVGPRFTARVGLAALALASIGFAVGDRTAALASARLLQGAAAAAAWAGALAWLVGVTKLERRGAVVGATLAAAFAGTVLGPALGLLANSVGREAVFVPLAAVVAAVAWWGGPGSTPRRLSRGRDQPPVLRDRRTLEALGLMAFVGVLSGCFLTLGALVLSERGVSSAAIAAVFSVGYGSQIVLTPIVGRHTDRTGPIPAIPTTLAICGTVLVSIPLISGPVASSLLLATGVSASAATYAPVAVIVSRIADQRELGRGVPMALTNGGWGLGAALGAAALAPLAESSGVLVAFLAAAALCGAGLASLLGTGMRTRLSAPGPGGAPHSPA